MRLLQNKYGTTACAESKSLRLQDVGEGAVLINLAIRLYDHPEWRVFQNYGEAGCDLLLLRTSSKRNGKQIKIEVKTRQNLLTDRKSKNSVHFTVSQSERDSADFLVAYWFDRGEFFIVPTSQLAEVNSGDKKVYKFIAYLKRDETFNDQTQAARNNWERITQVLT